MFRNGCPDVLTAERQLKHEQTQKRSTEKALKREQAKNSALDKHIEVLTEQLAALCRARYSRSSEQLDRHIYQLELMLEDLSASASEQRSTETSTAARADAEEEQTKKPVARQTLPESLPRDTHTHDVTQRCDDCGQPLVAFGEDVSEQLKYVPAHSK